MWESYNDFALGSISRIRSRFKHGEELEPSVVGTGFWLRTNDEAERTVYVTNRHNVDPTMKRPNVPDLTPGRVYVERREITDREATPVTHFYRVTNLAECLWQTTGTTGADCAILVEPELVGPVDPATDDLSASGGPSKLPRKWLFIGNSSRVRSPPRPRSPRRHAAGVGRPAATHSCGSSAFSPRSAA